MITESALDAWLKDRGFEGPVDGEQDDWGVNVLTWSRGDLVVWLDGASDHVGAQLDVQDSERLLYEPGDTPGLLGMLASAIGGVGA